MKAGPGLARLKEVPLLRTAKTHCLSALGIYRIIKQCEFIFEGQTVRENGTTSFFGSSMITLKTEKGSREINEKNLDEILQQIKNNPILNLQLIRMARLEASHRIAAAALGTAYYTVDVKRNASSIEITIDIEIPNIEHV